jgi:hypothetical protein
MFNNAQEVVDNLQACQRLKNQNLKSVANTKNDDKLEEQATLSNFFDTNLSSDPSHDKYGADLFMYSSVDSQENEFANQFVEEQVDVPSFFLLDDIAYVVDLSLYYEYNDDYDVDFLEKPVACSLSENVPFQQCNKINQPTYHSYKEEYEESIESTKGNSLPLCFALLKLLKENLKIITEAEECVLMKNHIDSCETIDKK